MVIHGVRIAEGCLIGAGAVVTDDLAGAGNLRRGSRPEDPMNTGGALAVIPARGGSRRVPRRTSARCLAGRCSTTRSRAR